KGLDTLIVTDRAISQTDCLPTYLNLLPLSNLRGLLKHLLQEIIGRRNPDWQVRPISEFTKYGGITNRSIETQPHHPDIFSILPTSQNLLSQINRYHTTRNLIPCSSNS